MEMAEVSKCRALLMAKRQEILGIACLREDILIVQSNEQVETVQLAGERELAARNLEREAQILAQVGAALKRIDDGEFGICLGCGEPISPKRLAAVPWAAYCLKCQEMRDVRRAADQAEPKVAARGLSVDGSHQVHGGSLDQCMALPEVRYWARARSSELM